MSGAAVAAMWPEPDNGCRRSAQSHSITVVHHHTQVHMLMICTIILVSSERADDVQSNQSSVERRV